MPATKKPSKKTTAKKAAKKKVLVPFPRGQKQRPFTLMWVETTAADRLRSGSLVFSEDVHGLAAKELAEPESAETTGATPEAADTTITF